MQTENRIASPHQNESRGGGGLQATARHRLLLLMLLATLAVIPQGCQELQEVTRQADLALTAPPEYKPILATTNLAKPAATPAPASTAPTAEPSARETPVTSAPPTPAGETEPQAPQAAPDPKPGEATRPGSPATWGESGSLAVGRRFDAIYFNGQDAELDAVARQRLAEYATWLHAHPQVWLTLTGHADRHAGNGYAYNLGMTRALAVADYLIGAGLDSRRLFTTSFGKDQPVSEEKTPEADALNNRVEMQGFVPPPGVDGPQQAGLSQDITPEPETSPSLPEGRDLPHP